MMIIIIVAPVYIIQTVFQTRPALKVPVSYSLDSTQDGTDTYANPRSRCFSEAVSVRFRERSTKEIVESNRLSRRVSLAVGSYMSRIEYGSDVMIKAFRDLDHAMFGWGGGSYVEV